MFNENFLNVDVGNVADSIKKDGFFFMERALSDAYVAQLLADASEHPFAINKNWVTGVHAPGQYYLTHMLACSEGFYHFVSSKKLRDVCQRVLGDRYRLKAMRYYETYGYHHMQWHTDNKTDRGFADIPGLIFIAYLQDVEDGEFQYVRGSQNWSGEKAYSDYSDAFITSTHGDDVISFKAPKGSVIIYDTYGIHRGRPVKESRFSRKSLFFQVDQNIESGEPLLLNPAFIPADDLNDASLRTYLGFGLPSEYRVYPNTDITTLPLHAVKPLAISRWFFYAVARAGYDRMPLSLRNGLRRCIGRSDL